MSIVSKKKYLISTIVGFLIVVLVVGGLIYKHKKDSPKISPNPGAKITSLPVSPTSTSGQKEVDTGSQFSQGTSTNTSAPSITSNSSEWTTSSSGLITLKQPLSDGSLTSGSVISGSAKVDKVQYTLIDNSVGVISQGIMEVNNGTFSASITFKNSSGSGRLDVFSLGADGQEENEVQIPVNF